ncbi:MAG: hypothetical protein J0L93_03420 [Deltaproteobacteria bacterium]|nr:hypothetical protein [Deltaproteobacteria bacterium]
MNAFVKFLLFFNLAIALSFFSKAECAWLSCKNIIREAGEPIKAPFEGLAAMPLYRDADGTSITALIAPEGVVISVERNGLATIQFDGLAKELRAGFYPLTSAYSLNIASEAVIRHAIAKKDMNLLESKFPHGFSHFADEAIGRDDTQKVNYFSKWRMAKTLLATAALSSIVLIPNWVLPLNNQFGTRVTLFSKVLDLSHEREWSAKVDPHLKLFYEMDRLDIFAADEPNSIQHWAGKLMKDTELQKKELQRARLIDEYLSYPNNWNLLHRDISSATIYKNEAGEQMMSTEWLDFLGEHRPKQVSVTALRLFLKDYMRRAPQPELFFRFFK